MQATQSEKKPKRAATWLIVGAAAVGAALGGAGIASAATGGSSSNSATTVPSVRNGNRPNPATMSDGPGETLLTGRVAEQVKSAALAAAPNATIIRVETDSAGSKYEAHITTADGKQETLKIDANFKVTSTEQGFGAGPRAMMPPPGA